MILEIGLTTIEIFYDESFYWVQQDVVEARHRSYKASEEQKRGPTEADEKRFG